MVSPRRKATNTRHRKSYTVRMMAAGKCIVCGKRAVTRRHCQKHRELHNACVRWWRSSKARARRRKSKR